MNSPFEFGRIGQTNYCSKEGVIQLMEGKSRIVPTLQVASEADIANFCGPCDHLMGDNSCQIDRERGNQARYVARDWCGWAFVNGVRGLMTHKGFNPNFGQTPSAPAEQPK